MITTPSKLGAELKRQIQNSIAQVEQQFRDRSAELNLKYCEFDLDYPPTVDRIAILPNGGQTLTATIRLNLCDADAEKPSQIVEAIEDWFDQFLLSWIATKTDAVEPVLRREREVSERWDRLSPPWKLQISRTFDLKLP